MSNQINKEEANIYNFFLDVPNICIWAIMDLLEHDNLLVTATTNTFHKELTELISQMLDYINEQLLKHNNHVLPKELIRNNKYPLIRQMRDVHQFDVGSHIGYCYMLAIRKSPITFCNKNFFPLLEKKFTNIISKNDQYKLSCYSAIFHDFFKCFRSRRPLPSKLEKKCNFFFYLPDGSETGFIEELDNEDAMAKNILPFFITNSTFCQNICETIEINGQIGKIFYKLLKLDSINDIKNVSKNFISKQDIKNISFWQGLYLSIIDWQGKGYARYLVTVRKNGVHSLDFIGKIFLKELELKLESTWGCLHIA